MSEPIYHRESTALLLVDPYNDFLSRGRQSVAADQAHRRRGGPPRQSEGHRSSRSTSDLRVCIAPHRRWEPGDYEDWSYPNATQIGIMSSHAFARGEWGGDWHPDLAPAPGDIVAKEHWAQSGFANTDLDQQMRQRGVTHVIVVGLLANTCVELDQARYAMELGYHVTLVRDGTAAFTREMMQAAHELNGPTFAHSILTTAQLITTLPTPQPATLRPPPISAQTSQAEPPDDLHRRRPQRWRALQRPLRRNRRTHLGIEPLLMVEEITHRVVNEYAGVIAAINSRPPALTTPMRGPPYVGPPTSCTYSPRRIAHCRPPSRLATCAWAIISTASARLCRRPAFESVA